MHCNRAVSSRVSANMRVCTVLLLTMTVTYACESSNDCQLNGLCIDGICECDAAWTGSQCQWLALEGHGSLAYGDPDHGTVTSWGGGPPAYDASTGKWTLFATEIGQHCGLTEWLHRSTVVKAEADTPHGPFKRQGVAIPAEAHNPYYAWDAKSKQHLIFHIGDGKGVQILCACVCTEMMDRD